MKIRSAEKKDLKDCENLIRVPELTYGAGHYIDKEFMENYLDPDLFLVGEINSEIIGLIISEKLKGKGIIIMYLVVKKEYQGKGFGRRLVAELEKRCKKTGINWAVLYAPAQNNETLKFYKKIGFIKGHNLYEFVKEF